MPSISETNIPTRKRDLFGGAITCELPSGLIDASDLRQVPDNQEVLLSPTSNLTHIVEILEAVEVGQSDEKAVSFHFSSLAHDNDALSTRILNTSTQNNAALLTGLQTVKKFSSPDSPLDLVLIHVAVWRLAPRKNIDVVMTWNEPIVAQEGEQDKQQSQSQSQEEVDRIQRLISGQQSDHTSALGSTQVRDAFIKAVQTFQIQDWSLFA